MFLLHVGKRLSVYTAPRPGKQDPVLTTWRQIFNLAVHENKALGRWKVAFLVVPSLAVGGKHYPRLTATNPVTSCCCCRRRSRN